MADPALIQAQIAAINAAIASGVTRVSYGDKSVAYASLADMLAIRRDLQQQLGLPMPSRRTVAAYNGGF